MGTSAVNGDISDLFFNTENDAATYSEGKFAGYDRAKLLEEAGVFLGSLERLGVATPTTVELVDDFLARV